MRTAYKRGLAYLVLGISASVWGWQALDIMRNAETNALINDYAKGLEPAIGNLRQAKPEVLLARALFLKQHKRYDDALAALSLTSGFTEPRLQVLLRYNLGNIYLEQAVAKAETMSINDAMPLVALAKQAYRQALSIDSHYWDAKYNLEVAMRLLPEMDKINSGDDENPPNKKAPLWTTVPGFPRGLP
ncbi:MxaK protein [Methylocucumis oryzae]|uniref:MxaK protein n=1 Tax=Methylocucumis oryzae TaxID=1632867 RepID=A0A0F3II74_9GAMM|nr:MxaK protein [Methylocucumis oryzae]KJV06367.1 MxaK protein [Methylocucumis oryzae]